MTDDVRISVTLRNHRKTRRLRKRLGADACWSLVCLFLFAGEQRWTGELHGMSAEDIEDEADWDGKPGEFVDTLVELRFLDIVDGIYVIHDWEQHNPFAATKGQRIEKGRKAAEARWSKAREHAPSMPGASHEHAPGNAKAADAASKQCPPAPAPAPTRPSESPDTSSLGDAAGADAGPPAADRSGAFEGHGPGRPADPDTRQRIAIVGVLRRLEIDGATAYTDDLKAYVAAGGTPEHVEAVAGFERCRGKGAIYVLRTATSDLTQRVPVSPDALITPDGRALVVGAGRAAAAPPKSRTLQALEAAEQFK